MNFYYQNNFQFKPVDIENNIQYDFCTLSNFHDYYEEFLFFEPLLTTTTGLYFIIIKKLITFLKLIILI